MRRYHDIRKGSICAYHSTIVNKTRGGAVTKMRMTRLTHVCRHNIEVFTQKVNNNSRDPLSLCVEEYIVVN